MVRGNELPLDGPLATCPKCPVVAMISGSAYLTDIEVATPI